MDNQSPHESGLLKVMVASTVLAFGTLGALMVSVKGFFGGSVSFRFSVWTVAAFVGGCVAGLIFWKIVLHLMKKSG